LAGELTEGSSTGEQACHWPTQWIEHQLEQQLKCHPHHTSVFAVPEGAMKWAAASPAAAAVVAVATAAHRQPLRKHANMEYLVGSTCMEIQHPAYHVADHRQVH
jgi:hypothetical protein